MNSSEYYAAKMQLENAQVLVRSLIRREAPNTDIGTATKRLRAASKRVEILLKDATPEEREQVFIDSAIIRREGAL